MVSNVQASDTLSLIKDCLCVGSHAAAAAAPAENWVMDRVVTPASEVDMKLYIFEVEMLDDDCDCMHKPTGRAT